MVLLMADIYFFRVLAVRNEVFGRGASYPDTQL